MSFAELGLHPLVLKSLDSEGYATPTPVQAASIPPALEGRDILATAATGTGKTAAFLLPALSRLAAAPKPGPAGAPRLLVLAPTRELATQVTQAVRKHGKFLRLTSADIVGGMPFRAQLQQLARPLDIVVATPGRLVDHLQRGRLDLRRVEVLVLDEADRMLDMGFAEDVDTIAKACAPGRQTMLFTATLDKRMSGLAGRLLNKPMRIAVAAEVAAPAIEHRLYRTNHIGHKRRLLNHFAASSDVTKAIVFVATKRDADNLAQDLTREGHRAAALHGDMDQHQRNHTMHRMRGGDLRLLVATDVAARGIDVRDISHVFNFDLPRSAADYVHRAGRTGRAGATGIAISFAGAADRGIVHNIERLTRSKFAVHTVAGLEAGPVPPRAPFRPEHRAARPDGRFAERAGEQGKARTWTKSYKQDGVPRRKLKRWASQTAR
jgi:superfamily II DNA/RNA helicase